MIALNTLQDQHNEINFSPNAKTVQLAKLTETKLMISYQRWQKKLTSVDRFLCQRHKNSHDVDVNDIKELSSILQGQTKEAGGDRAVWRCTCLYKME